MFSCRSLLFHYFNLLQSGFFRCFTVLALYFNSVTLLYLNISAALPVTVQNQPCFSCHYPSITSACHPSLHSVTSVLPRHNLAAPPAGCQHEIHEAISLCYRQYSYRNLVSFWCLRRLDITRICPLSLPTVHPHTKFSG